LAWWITKATENLQENSPNWDTESQWWVSGQIVSPNWTTDVWDWAKK
jgi:hypothetical protein